MTGHPNFERLMDAFDRVDHAVGQLQAETAPLRAATRPFVATPPPKPKPKDPTQ